MQQSEDYREVNVFAPNSSKVIGKVKVSLEHWELARSMRWVYRARENSIITRVKHGGKYSTRSIRKVLFPLQKNAPRIRGMRYVKNGDVFDCRKENIEKYNENGNIHRLRDRYVVRINVKGHLFNLGGWPTYNWAAEILEIVRPVANSLRSSDLTRPQVRRILRQTAGVYDRG